MPTKKDIFFYSWQLRKINYFWWASQTNFGSSYFVRALVPFRKGIGFSTFLWVFLYMHKFYFLFQKGPKIKSLLINYHLVPLTIFLAHQRTHLLGILALSKQLYKFPISEYFMGCPNLALVEFCTYGTCINRKLGVFMDHLTRSWQEKVGHHIHFTILANI